MSVFSSGDLPHANERHENDHGTVDAESPDGANRPKQDVSWRATTQRTSKATRHANQHDVRESDAKKSSANDHPEHLAPNSSGDVTTGEVVTPVGEGEPATNNADEVVKANGAAERKENAGADRADASQEQSSLIVQTFEKFWTRIEEITNPLTNQLRELSTQLRRDRIERWIDWFLKLIRAIPIWWAVVCGLLLPTVVAVIYRASHTDPQQEPPVAAVDAYEADENQLLTVGPERGVLANDGYADRARLSAVLVSNSKNGTVHLNSDGSFTYVPNPNFSGTDSFTYKAKNGSNESEAADVAITVKHVNHMPVGNDDRYTVDAGQTLTVDAAHGVLENDHDADPDRLSAVLVAHPSSGRVNLNGDGSFTYLAKSDFSGTDSFTYKARDGWADGNVVKVTIAVGDPEGAKVYFTDAVQDMRSNRLDPAVGNLTEAIRLDSGDARYFYLRAFALYFLGRINDAEADIRRGADAERLGRPSLSEINVTLDKCRCQGETRIKWFEPLRRKYLLRSANDSTTSTGAVDQR